MLPASLNNFRPFLKIPAFLLQTLDFVEREDGETRRWGEGTRGEGRGISDFRSRPPSSVRDKFSDCGLRIYIPGGARERGSDGTMERWNTKHRTPNTKHQTPNKVLSSNIFAHPYRHIRPEQMFGLPREDVPP